MRNVQVVRSSQSSSEQDRAHEAELIRCATLIAAGIAELKHLAKHNLLSADAAANASLAVKHAMAKVSELSQVKELALVNPASSTMQ
jgi:hypothetical protein